MLEYWFMFPGAILIATIAMVMGVGGALFFSPVFIILFPLVGVDTLTPAEAIGTALITELFGFSSGLFGYFRRKLIDFQTGRNLVLIALPPVIIGAILKHYIPDVIVLSIFSMGLMSMGVYTIRTNSNGEQFLVGKTGPKRIIRDSEGHTHEYEVCNINSGRALVGAGAMFTGLISVGIGETTVSTLKSRCGLPMKIASATSVFVVTAIVLTASLVDVAVIGIAGVPWDLLMFTIPGVLIGGQLGPKIASKVSETTAERFLVLMFFLVGIIMGYVAYLRF